MNEQAENESERRAGNGALLESMRELRQDVREYARRLNEIENDHGSRLIVLEKEGVTVAKKLESVDSRLANIERTVEGIPAAIAALIGQHEKSEMTLMLSIAGMLLVLVLGFLWDTLK